MSRRTKPIWSLPPGKIVTALNVTLGCAISIRRLITSSGSPAMQNRVSDESWHSISKIMI
jgi:hypothetical protein